MPASINDKLKKYKSLFSTTLSTGIGTGTSDTITPATVTGLPTDTAITLTIDRVDASGTATPSKMERIKGVVSSGNIINYVRAVDGTTEQAHTAGAVVEMVWNADDWNNAVDHLLVEHGQDGKHTKVNGNTVTAGTDTVALLTASQTLTNKTLTAPVINGAITGDAIATGATIITGTANDDIVTSKAIADSYIWNNSMARQAIINGNFDVWQRGTSVAMTAANAYTADRWYCETATAGTDKTVSREDGTGVNGSYYCARVKMVGDVDELLTFSQALESQDSIKFRGQKVTLSFYARGGAEFVADNATLVSKIVTGKGTDQKVLAFTTSADGVSQNNTLTTSWQKFTCTTTAAIANDITQIGVSFSFTHAGAGTTTNYFEVAQVQLCAGDVALPFMPKSYEDELRVCRRYYERHIAGSIYNKMGVGQGESTVVAYCQFTLKVTKRVPPTILDYSGNFSLVNGTDNIATTSLTLAQAGCDDILLACNAASGITVQRFYHIGASNDVTAYIGISSEF